MIILSKILKFHPSLDKKKKIQLIIIFVKYLNPMKFLVDRSKKKKLFIYYFFLLIKNSNFQES